MTTRVVVVSDTHLSRDRTPEATENWDAVVDYVRATAPDLVVHAGDVAADGPGHPDDLDRAAELLARLPGTVRVVPGNHDVGDTTGVSRTTLGRYRAALGPDRWSLDVPGWRLVGINALLFGSGLDEEADQWAWLADLAHPRDPEPEPRRIALILHKPLAAPPLRPGDTTAARYVPPAACKWLHAMFGAAGLAAVVSGHAHQYVADHRDAVTFVWAPSAWAIIPDRAQPRLGEKVCGVVDLRLYATGGKVDVWPSQPPGLAQHVLGETVKDPYDRGL